MPHTLTLEQAIAQRFPYHSEAGERIRNHVVRVCRYHIDSGLLDSDAEQRLCGQNHFRFWQTFSEVLLADQLAKVGLRPTHAQNSPDFLVEHDGQRIWVEVTAPEPAGLPPIWVNHVSGNLVSLPHEELLLRWTSAIKEKADKLLGRTDPKTGDYVPGYLDKGVVREQDAYVIAVNGRLLRGFGGASELVGISQFPFAVEATLAIGPLQVSIDATTLKKLSSGHQHRSFIRKPKGADVPTDTFLDPGFSPISAIWAVDVDEMMLLGQARPMVIVHNPSASIPLARNLLPAQEEYAARSYNDYFEVYLEDGLLANGAPRA